MASSRRSWNNHDSPLESADESWEDEMQAEEAQAEEAQANEAQANEALADEARAMSPTVGSDEDDWQEARSTVSSSQPVDEGEVALRDREEFFANWNPE